MNKEDLFVQRSLNQVIIVNKRTCQKLIITDKTMINKSDNELKNYCMKQGAIPCYNERV